MSCPYSVVRFFIACFFFVCVCVYVCVFVRLALLRVGVRVEFFAGQGLAGGVSQGPARLRET